MGLFGSLFTGVSTLSAQSQNTAIISNNIANVNTTGYKRSEASFNSLVTTESRLSRYSPGTVSVNRIQKVDQQGSIQQTSSATDASVSGNGFFPVKRSTNFGQEFLYTRAGQFSEDATGLLRNASGFILYGWPIDENGDLPADQGDLTSLVPVDVAFLGGLTRPTTQANLSINLNSEQERTNFTLDDNGITTSGPAHFSRGITVFDSLGSAQTLRMEFRHIYAPRSMSLSNQSGVELTSSLSTIGATGANDGETLTLSDGTDTFTFEYDDDDSVTGSNIAVSTMDDLINEINANFEDVEARLTSTGQLIVESNTDTTLVTASGALAAVGVLDMADRQFRSGGISLSDAGGLAGTDDINTLGAAEGNVFTVNDGTTTVTYEYDTDATVGAGNTAVTTVQDLLNAINADFAGNLNATLTASGQLSIEPVAGSGASITTGGTLAAAPIFTMTDHPPFVLPVGNTTNVADSANGDGTVFPGTNPTVGENSQGWWEIKIIHPNGTELTRGVLNFDSDGGINAASDINGNVDIMLEDIDWGNGSSDQDISIDISRFSQLGGNFDVITEDQNGAELGLRTGVEIDRDGRVIARFSNGASTALYQVPLVTFANANGLNEVSGTAYTETEASGEENLRRAGTGGAGFVEPSTLEASNVDLADEFARLIVSQRAFGAGTRLINTVDQMTEDLLRLR